MSAAKFIDVGAFNERVELEASARTLFYEDVDSGKFPGLPRDWTLMPLVVREHYRLLAVRIERKISPPPSWWTRTLTFCGVRRRAEVRS